MADDGGVEVLVSRAPGGGTYRVWGLDADQLAGRRCMACGGGLEPGNPGQVAVVGYIPRQGVAVGTVLVPVWVHTWEAEAWRLGQHPARQPGGDLSRGMRQLENVRGAGPDSEDRQEPG